ncbi:DUF4304 domain-containing protein [Mucilaginibacter psychrotolerans]|uniref:DUF4304 domain-containing protein n=1 Tax=Mucilaginibacter psychrotolerans TaxID=1524096 RepID=A0A4Y8SEC0_9SPHI|nr:DUF4304 domain-containing protein [Mucilaginibacter psychrotolerans]TFF37463.1 DUF4304 domain-containing protein [Mucilaginibacter psychrotolerans]
MVKKVNKFRQFIESILSKKSFTNKTSMTGKELRLLMDRAIKDIAVPFFRNKGFKGSYPHFRRINDDRVNLLTFQFSMSGPKFVVEISNCSPKGVQRGWGPDIPPSKCTAHDMHLRHRIGAIKHNTHYWFDFSSGETNSNIYAERAKEIMSLWDEAETWWDEDPHEQRFALIPKDNEN